MLACKDHHWNTGIPLQLGIVPHDFQHFLEMAAYKWLLRKGRICFSVLSEDAKTRPEKSFWW